MDFWRNIFGKRKPQPPETKPEGVGPVYMTRMVVFGRGDSSVHFVDENRGIRKMLVDENGVIQRFPGIVKEAFWTGMVSAMALMPRIRYRTDFERRVDGWRMLWQVQPDGAYWADGDGFGRGSEEEIILYTDVDENGNFTGPFRIYSIGDRDYVS